MNLTWPAKDPNGVTDYGVDWSAWLGSDTIVSSSWILPAGITMNSHSHTDKGTTIWFSAGTAGGYRCTNRITTAGGRQQDETAVLTVRQR